MTSRDSAPPIGEIVSRLLERATRAELGLAKAATCVQLDDMACRLRDRADNAVRELQATKASAATARSLEAALEDLGERQSHLESAVARKVDSSRLRQIEAAAAVVREEVDARRALRADVDGLGEQCQALARAAEAEVSSGEKFAQLLGDLRKEVARKAGSDDLRRTAEQLRGAVGALESATSDRSMAVESRVGELERRQSASESAADEHRLATDQAREQGGQALAEAEGRLAGETARVEREVRRALGLLAREVEGRATTGSLDACSDRVGALERATATL